MDVLIDLSLRAVCLALIHPFTRGLLFVLVALYGAGSGWPGWGAGLFGVLGVGFWLAPLWRLGRNQWHRLGRRARLQRP